MWTWMKMWLFHVSKRIATFLEDSSDKFVTGTPLRWELWRWIQKMGSPLGVGPTVLRNIGQAGGFAELR